MFSLLKKKFKKLTDKVIGRSKEKIEDDNTLDKTKDSKDDSSKVSEEQEIPKEIPKEEKEIPKEEKEIPKEEKEIPKEEKEIPKEEKETKDFVNLKKINLDSKEKTKETILDSKDKTKETISKKPTETDFKQTDTQKDNLVYEIDIFKKTDNSSFLKKSKKDDKSSENQKIKGEFLSVPPIDSFKDKTDSDKYKSLERDKKDIKPKAISSIKSVFSSKVTLTRKEINDFLDDFEMGLLESDVSVDGAGYIVQNLKKRLSDISFSKKNLKEDILIKIKEILLEQLNVDCNINNFIENKKPIIILFIGPNGAGKTTTIAKFAKMFKDKQKDVVLASSDTFRAGSIDQLQKHADNIGVNIVKQKYGSDPAAVAYDAVLSAKSKNSDFVLIDTAGRQDTNINLLKELEKIKRVVSPDITIYIGESQSGQSVVEQISKFDKEIGITGVILTKIDTDPKGGVALSILSELKKPIFYITNGQEYNNIVDFNAKYIIDRIIE